MTTSGRIPQSTTSSKHAMKSSKKIKKFSTKDYKMTSAPTDSMEAAAVQQPLYYYYYYPDETLPSTAISDEQQYFYANNYYYYAIDGTSDVNYHPEFFIQPAGNNENYMR